MKISLAKKILPLHDVQISKYHNPYIVECRKGSRSILVIGMHHKLTQVAAKEVERYFIEYILSKKNTALVIEGFPNTTKLHNKKLARYINATTEKCVARALQKKIDVFGSELSTNELIKIAQQLGSKKEHIAAWAFLNVLHGLINAKGRISQKGIAQLPSTLKSICAATRVASRVDTPAEQYTIIRKVLVRELGDRLGLPRSITEFLQTRFKPKILYLQQAPVAPKNKIQAVAVNMNIARDYAIAMKVVRSSKKYQMVCALFGLNHVISQMPLYASLGYERLQGQWLT